MHTPFTHTLAAAALLVLGLGTAHADFMKDHAPSGAKLYFDQPYKNVDAFSGHVGSNVGPVVNATSIEHVNTGGGFAHITPVKDSLLTSVTFTPVNDTLFAKFSLRGQLLAPGNVTINVVDQNLQSFVFTILSPDTNSLMEVSHSFDECDVKSFERYGSPVLPGWLAGISAGGLYDRAVEKLGAFTLGMQVSRGVRAQVSAS